MSAPSSDGTTEPFWRRKQLEEMTPQEWESLCDGCGKCCLHKIQYEDTGELCYTNVACKLLDLGMGHRLFQRRERVPQERSHAFH